MKHDLKKEMHDFKVELEKLLHGADELLRRNRKLGNAKNWREVLMRPLSSQGLAR